MRSNFFFFAILVLISFGSCDKGDDPVVEDPVFNVSTETINFDAEGGSTAVTVTMNGSSWVVTSNQAWCTVSPNTSSKAADQVTVSATANATESERTAKLTFVMDEKETRTVTVVQDGQEPEDIYPDYSSRIDPDATGMDSEAKTLAAKMTVGWNLGNSLEVPGDETGWGNPKTTQRLIDSVAAAGINAIRIPVSWNSYMEDAGTAKLKESWLARVKEVVDYCYNKDMYVTINIHWDGGWLEENPTYAKQEEVNAKQKAFWEQIAVYFRDYDEHLLFAGTNEVHGEGNPIAENFEVQMSYNQTFVDAVRSTGGRNSYRNLIIQTFSTNIDHGVNHLVVSDDSVEDRLMVEVHYYDPWDFCGLEEDASWATVKYLWGEDFAQYGTISDWGQEDYLLGQFQKMKTNFVDKGYPVILGEFGASRRSSLQGEDLEYHLESRAYFFEYIGKQAKDHGMVPFIWDNGYTGNRGMAIFNRNDGSVFDRQGLDAYLSGASVGSYPF